MWQGMVGLFPWWYIVSVLESIQSIKMCIRDRYSMDDLLQIMKILRAPGGCPWDREQTHQSIRNCFIEETYEAIEAIDTEDPILLQEELGDVLLQVLSLIHICWAWILSLWRQVYSMMWWRTVSYTHLQAHPRNTRRTACKGYYYFDGCICCIGCHPSEYDENPFGLFFQFYHYCPVGNLPAGDPSGAGTDWP